jgi:hypothetical protein
MAIWPRLCCVPPVLDDGFTIEIKRLAADVLALEPGAPHAGAHSLDDQAALEFGDSADDDNNGTAQRAAGVDLLAEADELDVQPVQIWNSLGTPGNGSAIGLAMALPFLPGMFGSRKTGGQMRDIYSREEPFLVRCGRWWELRSTSLWRRAHQSMAAPLEHPAQGQGGRHLRLWLGSGEVEAQPSPASHPLPSPDACTPSLSLLPCA